MKLREWFYALGLKPGIREYGIDEISLDVPSLGAVQWARWAHPKCRDITPEFGNLDFFRRILSPGDLVIDIGAHVGDTTLPPALALGNAVTVLALEPNPSVFKVLARNATLNAGRMHIVPVNAAVMEQDGSYTFRYNDPGLANGGYQKGISWRKHASFFEVEVQGLNLPAYIDKHMAKHLPDHQQRVRFIKSDTEGHDYTIFKTLRGLIDANKPFLQLEINRYLPVEERVAFHDDLVAGGYTIHRMTEREKLFKRRLATRDDFAQDGPTFDILAVPAGAEALAG